jgi:phage-related protein (TIGR01555 family)
MSPISSVVRTTDAFSNPAARLGFGTMGLLQGTEYPLTRLTHDYNLLNSLYRGNWIIQNIIDTIPEDMCKHWVTVNSQVPPAMIDKLTAAVRRIGLKRQILQGLKWGRLYGGAAGLILIAGQEGQLAEPLALATVMPDTFRGLYVVDRWAGVYPSGELVQDINSPAFGLPAFYEFRNETDSAVYRVHHSRIIRFTGRDLPYWEHVAEMYWGSSEVEAVYDEVKKRDNASFNIAELIFRARLAVYEMDGLDQLFGSGGAQAQQRFWEMMQAQSYSQNNFGVQLVNRGDKYDVQQLTFSGLADVYNSMMLDVAGAARMPVMKLFGRSPSGLNATGEGDLQNYYDHIEQEQEAKLRPVLDTLLPILAVSAWGEIPDDLDFDFQPIRSTKIEDTAQVARFKTQAIIEAFNAGALDQSTMMKECREMSGDTAMFTNITDEMIEAARGKWVWDLGAMADPFAHIRPFIPEKPGSTLNERRTLHEEMTGEREV